MIIRMIIGILSYEKKIEILKKKNWYKNITGLWVNPHRKVLLHPIQIIFSSIEEITKL